jgi:chromosome segregation ATPase
MAESDQQQQPQLANNGSVKSNEQVSSNNNSPNLFETFTNQTNLDEINSKISQINAELSTLKFASKNQSNTLNNLNNSNESLNTKQFKLESEMNKLIKNFDAIKSITDSVAADIKRNSQSTTAVNTDLSNFKLKSDNKFIEIDTNIKQLLKNILTYKNLIETAGAEQNKLNIEVDTIVINQKKDKQDLDLKITSLNTNINNNYTILSKQITDVNNQCLKMIESVLNNTKKVNELEINQNTKYNELKSSYDSLKNQYDALISRLDKLENRSVNHTDSLKEVVNLLQVIGDSSNDDN